MTRDSLNLLWLLTFSRMDMNRFDLAIFSGYIMSEQAFAEVLEAYSNVAKLSRQVHSLSEVLRQCSL